MKQTLRKMKAKFYKTFVTDCPQCHQYFYGNQPYGVHVYMKNKKGIFRNYRYVCHVCKQLAATQSGSRVA